MEWAELITALYQNHNRYSGGSGEPPKQKPPKKPIKLWVKIVCGAAACLVISAGSIGGFIGLVNMGAIPFSASGTNSSKSHREYYQSRK